jgi:hypothetical protein
MGNPHLSSASIHLDLSRQSTYRDASRDHVAEAAVHAHLAVAYELNTIGRILAYNSDILAPVNNAGKQTSALQHNAIVERLGL